MQQGTLAASWWPRTPGLKAVLRDGPHEEMWVHPVGTLANTQTAGQAVGS